MVQDITAPVIDCPDDLVLECIDVVPTTLATATDACTPAALITVTYTDAICYNPVMGFTGPYAPANWTITTDEGGSVIPNGIIGVTLIGPDEGCNGGASVYYGIEIPASGVIHFNWNYTSFDEDGPLFDPFGYTINGVFFQLTDNLGPLNQSGSVNVTVNAGDTF